MMCLEQNKQLFYYALQLDSVELVDEHGNRTGQYQLNYSEPMQAYMNISPARGAVGYEQYGLSTDYTRTIVTDDINCPISETSHLWLGIEPTEIKIVDGVEVAVKVPHNYVVESKSVSLNSVTYVIRAV